MHDIDLVPSEYVEARRLRHRLVLLGAALALVLITVASARAWLALRLDRERAGLELVRQHGRVAGEQRSRLAALQAQKAAGDAQLATLRTLLDVSAFDALWPAVDAAYNDRVWLETLSYARTARADAAVVPSAQVVTPATPSASAVSATAPTLQHEVDLSGHGLDHAAVSAFKQALGAREGIASLRLADSGLKQLGTLEVVAFHFTALLGPSPRPLP
jgi:hypothetical protein